VKVTWTRAAIAAKVEVSVGRVADAPRPLHRVRLRVANESPWDDPSAPRDRALIASLVGVHLIACVDGGTLLSAIDPPDWARAWAASCPRGGLHPALIGDVILAAPIILEDHAAIAPESHGDLFDACEIDEILTLRTRTLTDDEKRLASATDPRVARLIARADALDEAGMAALHGALRAPRAGSRVKLKPGARRTDAQDMFLVGRVATVRKVERDVDGRTCLAVTVDDDPAADLYDSQGRYHYFYPDEVEPL
jgi:hypothetical protein